jgi:hypothetical protein
LVTGKKRRTTPIRVSEPGVVPLSDEDRQQAVTAISSMIEAWWTRQNRDGEPAAVNSDEGSTHPR